jgi:hypothetical protein
LPVKRGQGTKKDARLESRAPNTYSIEEQAMIVEERIYTLKVGKVPEQFKIYEELGLAAQKRILGGMVGYYMVEVGGLNTVVHMWAYEDMNDREKRRAQLMQDPDFKKYLAGTAGIIERQENRILKPAPFFEKTLRAMWEVAKG